MHVSATEHDKSIAIVTIAILFSFFRLDFLERQKKYKLIEVAFLQFVTRPRPKSIQVTIIISLTISHLGCCVQQL